MKLLFFQYGDYGAAWRRFADGGAETYRDQRASIAFVETLAHEHDVTVIAIDDRVHDEQLAPRLRSIGIASAEAYQRRVIDRLLDDLAPERIICRTPHPHVLRWAVRHRVPTLPVFADIFGNDGLRQIGRNLHLRRLLGQACLPCVANHSLNASRSLATALFYPRDKIVPWDWTRLTPAADAKTAPADPARPIAFFAGALSDPKGVGDCLEATRLLRERGTALRFIFAGPGDVPAWRRRAEALGIADAVDFIGTVAHSEVRQRMTAADIVIVPSRHDYAEGLPNTIYEALASRTPLLISDHPAFAGRLADGKEAAVFRAADPRSMADRIVAVISDQSLYAALSASSARAHDSLYIGMEWKDLVTAFLDDPLDRNGWVARNSLAALTGDSGR